METGALCSCCNAMADNLVPLLLHLADPTFPAILGQYAAFRGNLFRRQGRPAPSRDHFPLELTLQLLRSAQELLVVDIVAKVQVGGGGRSGRGAVLVVHTLGMAAAPGVACPAGAESLSAVLNMPATSTGSVTGSP